MTLTLHFNKLARIGLTALALAVTALIGRGSATVVAAQSGGASSQFGQAAAPADAEAIADQYSCTVNDYKPGAPYSTPDFPGFNVYDFRNGILILRAPVTVVTGSGVYTTSNPIGGVAFDSLSESGKYRVMEMYKKFPASASCPNPGYTFPDYRKVYGYAGY